MMKQVFLVILLAFGFVAGAQNVTVRKPKKQKPATTHVTPKKERPSKQREVQSKKGKADSHSKKAEVDISPTIGKANYTPNVKTFYANGVSFEMVEVRGGTFRMGGTSEQGSDADSDDEYPVHSVTLSGYYIGKTEVTQALWKAVMGSNPSYWKGDNLPVEQVSWDDCQEFIRKLNALTGQNFRLPTEAEWEFACRGGNNSRGYKYSGSNYIDNVAWYGDNSGDKTHPVATKLPNELGIYDMSGNVWEWCSDWYDKYSSGAQTNPKGPYDGSRRVRRGGSWDGNARRCRSSWRDLDWPRLGYDYHGLRLTL
ncbi:MAG: formylglycine-generating enzyme family protein [Sodaliphilus sp.]|nr:formylglycine-generating enzyme family protein [Sodaliphilus sp.]